MNAGKTLLRSASALATADGGGAATDTAVAEAGAGASAMRVAASPLIGGSVAGEPDGAGADVASTGTVTPVHLLTSRQRMTATHAAVLCDSISFHGDRRYQSRAICIV